METTESGVETPGHAGRVRQGNSVRRARLFLHELERLLRLAGPLIVSQLGLVGMNTADTIMVGPLGATPLAAAGLGSALHTFGLVVCVGAIVGMSPLISQAFGAGDLAQGRRVLAGGLWLAILLSIPTVALNLAGEPIALALGQRADVAALTGGYLTALAPGLPAYFLFMAVRQFLEGIGKPNAPMIITFFGLALNVAMNRLLIYGWPGHVPAMGLAGSGWATSIVRWTMLAATAAYLALQPGLHALRSASLRPKLGMLRRIGTIGAPISAQFGLEVGLFSFAAIMMGWLGPLELAAHQVTINIASTTFMVALGVSLAGSIRVGHNIGAGRPRAVRRAALGTYLLAAGFMALCALAFILAGEPLIRLYTHDPAIVRLGATLLLVAAAFQLFDGGQVAGMGVLRGAADTRIPMIIAGVGYLGIGVPAGYLLAFHTPLGPVGVWIGLSLGLAIVASLLALRARRVLWTALPGNRTARE